MGSMHNEASIHHLSATTICGSIERTYCSDSANTDNNPSLQVHQASSKFPDTSQQPSLLDTATTRTAGGIAALDWTQAPASPH